jgi:hypothetical protein
MARNIRRRSSRAKYWYLAPIDTEIDDRSSHLKGTYPHTFDSVYMCGQKDKSCSNLRRRPMIADDRFDSVLDPAEGAGKRHEEAGKSTNRVELNVQRWVQYGMKEYEAWDTSFHK